MRQLVKFLEKYRYFLLFLILEFLALFFTIQSHSYHKSKFVNSANIITGGIYNKLSSINQFWSLRSENKLLLEENTKLKNRLALEVIKIDSAKSYKRYSYSYGKIIKNDYTKQNNYLLLNRGSKNGITSEMAVVNSKGIVGVTKGVSNYNATITSILNSNSRVNAKPKDNNHFGTLTWNGKDYKTVQLVDLPRQAQFKIGDTIVTGGKSTIFPEGVLIGTIKDFEKTNNVYNHINIGLFNDMSSLGNVHIIKNLQRDEIEQLEKTNNE